MSDNAKQEAAGEMFAKLQAFCTEHKVRIELLEQQIGPTIQVTSTKSQEAVCRFTNIGRTYVTDGDW